MKRPFQHTMTSGDIRIQQEDPAVTFTYLPCALKGECIRRCDYLLIGKWIVAKRGERIVGKRRGQWARGGRGTTFFWPNDFE